MKDSESTILFNPVNVVHDRNTAVFEKALKGWNIRRIYNPSLPWYPKMRNREGDAVLFVNGRVPPGAFDGVKAVVLFTAQVRVPPCGLVEQAALRSIPVIAIEEVFQMMLEQGYANEYLLPVDRLFVASGYEREKFIAAGVPDEVINIPGCPFLRKRGLSGAEDISKDDIRKTLGLTPGKKVATLSLSFPARSGETAEVRKGLLSVVAGGLPDDYELVVKPSPAEDDANFDSFVRRYAPRARIADRFAPIERILGITDVLFNRGNSQVILDSLCRGIPVIAVPLGRTTIFAGLSLDHLIADKGEDVPAALERVKNKDMSLYDRLFAEHLSIPPEAALCNAVNGIVEIARGKKLYDPARRLAELSVFWAFMGYKRQALRTLSSSEQMRPGMPAIKNIARLIMNKNDDSDLTDLKRWCGSGTYREWITQSLWIRGAFMRGKTMSVGAVDWLNGFPPQMCKELFFDFACMLNRSYIKSGLYKESRALSDKLNADFGSFADMKKMWDGASGGRRLSDIFYRMNLAVKGSARNILWECYPVVSGR